MIKIVKLFLIFFQFLLIFLICLLAFYFLNDKFSFTGEYKSFVVQSGSMEPSIMTGDIIIIQPKEEYFINDTITFIDSGERIVTHRITLVEGNDKSNFSYSTKGDANRVGDEDNVNYENVLGKVILVLPRLGFLVSFSKTNQGLIVMVLIPVIILALDQLLKIINATKKKN